VLALDYPSFDVIAVNDRSTDDTGPILDEMAHAAGERMRVLHIRPGELPDGWLGKCNALHVGSRNVTGEWILFVDSDVKVEPQALRATLALCVSRKYDALSILTRLECNTLIEQLILPLAAGAWSVMFAISITNDDKRLDSAAANGQFFLIRREPYERVEGHAAVFDQICEDVELMRLLKARGNRVRFLFGAELASTRMHATLRKMFSGWARIYCGSARRRVRRIIEAMMFLVVSGLSVYPALAWGIYRAAAFGQWSWFSASVAHWLLATVFLATIYRDSGNRARLALLFPVSGSVVLAIMGYALRLCRTGRMNWRGTDIHAVTTAATRLASVRKR
jgi:cellulose synthase/poly-beta-1,6-N-acetylglucosamine synthase-like glycosyltransferase